MRTHHAALLIPLILCLLLQPLVSHGMENATLITNGFAFRHPDAADAVISPEWKMTAGSLFRLPDGRYWTGVPDGVGSDAQSIRSTNSAVFRMVSTQHTYKDVAVHITFALSKLLETPKTPANAWDGVHLMLRYQSQYELYYISLSRRDHTLVIKKKCAGGPSNGGTYYELTPYVPYTVPQGRDVSFTARVQDISNNAVHIALYDGKGMLLLSGEDHGTGCAPILSPGSIGVRGDNAEFTFSLQAVPLPS